MLAGAMLVTLLLMRMAVSSVRRKNVELTARLAHHVCWLVSLFAAATLQVCVHVCYEVVASHGTDDNVGCTL